MNLPINNFTLIRAGIRKNKNYHPSIITTIELEDEITKYLQPNQHIEKQGFLFKVFKRVVNKLPFILSWIKTDKIYFGVLMGHIALYNKVPFFLLNASKKIIYLFDAWEPLESEIVNIVNKFGIHIILFSSEDACNYYKTKLTKIKCYWVPEGINLNKYKFYPLEKKNIDVLQLGRKYDNYHNSIVQSCKTHEISYLYEETKGKIIFPTQNDFIDGLARTKISICFPSSLTHPERSGSFSTMTRRYLESMAAKCLIIGALPSDMKNIFSYNPIIEVNSTNPAKQLLEILNNFEYFHPLIEKNYKEVRNNHQWISRCQQIENIIQNL